MREMEMEKLVDIGTLILIIVSLIFVVTFLSIKFSPENNFCDYDSCSQEIYKWNYNGSTCFDYNNPECQDFLRLWNVCQDYKNKLGVC